MRALITGVTGFVGSWLSRRLIDEGWEVYGLVRGRSDNHRFVRLRMLRIDSKVKLVNGDMTDPVSLQKAVSRVKPDVIFHLAAQSFVGRSFEAPLESFNINAYGTVALLEAVRHYAPDAKVIVAGSSEEYGKQFITEREWEAAGKPYPKPRRFPELPIKESNPLRPVSPYALSKVAEDYACRSYAMMYGLKCIPLRPFNTEGPLRGDHFVTATIVRQLVGVKLGLQKYVELGNVAAMRDWSHIEDVKEAYYLAATKLEKYGEPLNVGTGEMHSVLSFLVKAFEVVFNDEVKLVRLGERSILPEDVNDYVLEYFAEGVEPFRPDTEVLIIGGKDVVHVKLVKERFRPADVPHLQADASRFSELTGWKPRKRLEDIIEDLAAFYMGRWRP